MKGHSLVLRTAKGQREIEARSAGLPGRLRMALVLIDDFATVDAVLAKAAQLADMEAMLGMLTRHGYAHITGESEPPPGDTACMKAELMAAAHELLGARAARTVERLREAPNDRDGLEAVLDRCLKAIRLTIDEGVADALGDRCRAVLARF